MSPRRHHVDHPVDQRAEDQLRRIAEDDALLEALARRDDSPLVAGHPDDVSTLLRALTVDVDTHAERAASRPVVVPSLSRLPAAEPRRHPMRVRRSTAALALLGAIVAGSTGVAAAVTGDPLAGLNGLQRVIEVATSGRAEVPGEVRHAPSPEMSASSDGSPAVPAAPGGVPGSTVTSAPAPDGARGGRKLRTPGAVLPTASPREAVPSSPSSSGPAGRPSAAEPSTEHQRSKSTNEPAPVSPSRATKKPEPTDSPSPGKRRDHGGADGAPAPDPGRPGVSSSSPHEPEPATGDSRSPRQGSPAPPAEGD